MERTEPVRKDRVGWGPGQISRNPDGLRLGTEGKRTQTSLPQARVKDGAEDKEESFDPGGQGGKGLRMASALHRENGPAPGDASRTS